MARALALVVGAAMVAVAAWPRSLAALQSPTDSLFQLEITDSIGLPLPDAKVEWLTYLEGGVWREWVPIEPQQLEPGMHLLRFSHAGYHPTIISVPLEKGRRASLRVRLTPRGRDSDSTVKRDAIEASAVHAIGLVLGGAKPRDFIGERRVVDRAAIERTERTRLTDILRHISGAGLMVLPLSGGQYLVRAGGRGVCTAGVMVDGKPNRIMTVAAFDQVHWASEPEVIEVVERGTAIPSSFRRGDRSDCAMLLVWLRGR